MYIISEVDFERDDAWFSFSILDWYKIWSGDPSGWSKMEEKNLNMRKRTLCLQAHPPLKILILAARCSFPMSSHGSFIFSEFGYMPLSDKLMAPYSDV